MGISSVLRTPVIRSSMVRGSRLMFGGGGPSIVTDGLLAEYRFDDGSGQVLTDYSGNAKHGELGSTSGVDTNDPTWDSEGLVFGTDDACSLPEFSTTPGDWTLQFAYNPISINNLNEQLIQIGAGLVIAAHQSGDSAAHYGYHSGGSWRNTTAPNATAGRQIATFVLKATDLGQIYVNLTAATMADQTYSAAALGSTISLGSNQPMSLGFIGAADNCVISYFLVYSGALSDADRINNYNALKEILSARNSAWDNLP